MRDLVKTLTPEQRMAIDSHFPVCIVSTPGGGKTTAYTNISDEDKKRTLIINSDGKGLSNSLPFKKIILLNKESILKHAEAPNTETIGYNDPEGFDKLVKHLQGARDGALIDRVIVDSFTTFTDWVELLANMKTSNNKFEGFKVHNELISEFINIMKSYSLSKKLFYVIAHYMFGTTEKAYIKVNGNKHKGNIEGYFTSIVLAKKGEVSRKFFFVADTFSSTDSSRTAVKGGKLSIARYSLMDLEDFLLNDSMEERKKIVQRAREDINRDLNINTEEVFYEDAY